MRTLVRLAALLLLVGCDTGTTVSGTSNKVSDIKADESVVFFRTSGWLDTERQQWHLRVHGWIYEPEDSVVRKAAFRKILKRKYELDVTEQTEDNFSERVNLIIADNERGKTIVVRLAGGIYELPESANNGHFEDIIVIPADAVDPYVRDGFLRYSAVTRKSESRTFEGVIRLVAPRGLSVISDIDDTVKVSNVGDRRGLLENTFLLDFKPAPGMAATYRNWTPVVTSFHYVSSSPWQLYQPLQTFLDRNRFPWATFSLKAVRFRDETLFDLFKKGTETKPAQLVEILDRYPDRQFVLVGDSGEQDPEVYAGLMRDRPDQVLSIFIRNVSAETSDSERFQAAFSGLDADDWVLFDNPATLSLPNLR